jgi:hypothetical protein
MHSFDFKKLPLSFAEMWQTNLERNPVKRLPIIWNSAPGDKFNVKQHLYLKNLKELLLSAI